MNKKQLLSLSLLLAVSVVAFFPVMSGSGYLIPPGGGESYTFYQNKWFALPYQVLTDPDGSENSESYMKCTTTTSTTVSFDVDFEASVSAGATASVSGGVSTSQSLSYAVEVQTSDEPGEEGVDYDRIQYSLVKARAKVTTCRGIVKSYELVGYYPQGFYICDRKDTYGKTYFSLKDLYGNTRSFKVMGSVPDLRSASGNSVIQYTTDQIGVYVTSEVENGFYVGMGAGVEFSYFGVEFSVEVSWTLDVSSTYSVGYEIQIDDTEDVTFQVRTNGGVSGTTVSSLNVWAKPM